MNFPPEKLFVFWWKVLEQPVGGEVIKRCLKGCSVLPWKVEEKSVKAESCYVIRLSWSTETCA